MIRRPAGDDFLLITQNDHAIVARQLAEHFGNSKFERPLPGSPALLAIGLHDAGWPLHDDEPTLNDRMQPLDVFETPRTIALPVWTLSADRAELADPYAGLLVSLHQLSLSIHATPPPAQKDGEPFDVQKMHDQFAVNKFQHREVERQEKLRSKVGLSTRVPLKHGLAEAGLSEADDQLRFDFRLLQAMDLLSLCVCCAKLPMGETNEVLKTPTAAPIKLRVRKDVSGVVSVDPWPFDVKTIELQIPCRRVPGKRFESLEAFCECYRKGGNEILSVRLGA
jgi:hypothetical protein